MIRLEDGTGYGNRAFVDWLGYTVEELSTMGGILGAVVDKHQAEEMAAMSRRGGLWVGEVEFHEASGQVRKMQTRFCETTREGSRAKTQFVLLSEESEARALADQIERLRSGLRAAERSETAGVITRGVMHEFNNTLQTICGFTRLAMEGMRKTDRGYQDLRTVCQAVERASLLTRQLQATASRGSVRLMEIDVNELIRDHVKITSPLVGERIEVTLDLSPDVGILRVDPADLEQALLALSLSARDAMPEGGEMIIRSRQVEFESGDLIDVKGAKPGWYTEISVRDDGPGMDAETLAKACRERCPVDPDQPRVGFGLPVVERAIARYGGFMRVSSGPSGDTTVQLWYPAPREADAPLSSDAHVRGDDCILVAEDDGLLLDLARRILREAGYDVIAAHDGEEAIRLFEENKDRISLVISDVVMPKRTGFEVYDRVIELKPECKVVFVSGYDPITSHVGFISQRSLPLLTKPFRPQDLLLAIRQVMHGEPTWSAI